MQCQSDTSMGEEEKQQMKVVMEKSDKVEKNMTWQQHYHDEPIIITIISNQQCPMISCVHTYCYYDLSTNSLTLLIHSFLVLLIQTLH